MTTSIASAFTSALTSQTDESAAIAKDMAEIAELFNSELPALETAEEALTDITYLLNFDFPAETQSDLSEVFQG